MTLTEAECAHFNNLKFMSEVDLKHSFCDIINDTVLYFYDHENLKKTLSKFIYITNAENSALLLINHHSNFVVEIYQDFQKTLSEFIYTTHINNFTVSFCYHDSDFVTESSSFLMHDNCADISVIASASHSHC